MGVLKIYFKDIRAAILKEIFGLLFKPMSEFSGYEKALQATDGYAVDVQPLKLCKYMNLYG